MTRPYPRRARTDSDPVAVDRIMSGQLPRWWSGPEMVEAVARMTAAGMSAAAIADRVGITERSVCRYRARRETLNAQPVDAATCENTSDGADFHRLSTDRNHYETDVVHGLSTPGPQVSLRGADLRKDTGVSNHGGGE